jgi:hypothetical protein
MLRNTEKKEKIRNAHCRTCNLSRNLKKMENEIQKLFDLEYGGKHSKTWKIRNAQCRIWNMVRKLKMMEKEKHTL